MMSDSTNATNPTFTPSEAEVGKVLSRVISQAQGRVIVASFASHIHRLQQICDAAVANGRKVVVTGRSMVQNTDIARKLGYLKISDQDIIDAYDLKGIPPEQVVIMCTGSQGEPLSALARIAAGEHKTIDMEPGDTVIISATPVPGNEKAVTKVVNSLAKIGADVWDKSRARVHVSGHASAEELKIMLTIVQPKAFMPVHGEATHLRAHARLAEAVGVPAENVFICENGESLELSTKGVKHGETVQSGIVFVDGLSVGDTSEQVLEERTALGSQALPPWPWPSLRARRLLWAMCPWKCTASRAAMTPTLPPSARKCEKRHDESACQGRFGQRAEEGRARCVAVHLVGAHEDAPDDCHQPARRVAAPCIRSTTYEHPSTGPGARFAVHRTRFANERGGRGPNCLEQTIE